MYRCRYYVHPNGGGILLCYALNVNQMCAYYVFIHLHTKTDYTIRGHSVALFQLKYVIGQTHNNTNLYHKKAVN